MASECPHLEHECVMRDGEIQLDYHRCGLSHVKCVGERNCPVRKDAAKDQNQGGTMNIPRECPFCHANANRLDLVLKNAGKYPNFNMAAYVRCLNCNARGPRVVMEKRREYLDEIERRAWDKWNGGQP